MIENHNIIDPEHIDTCVRRLVVANWQLFPLNKTKRCLDWYKIKKMGRSEIVRILEQAGKIDPGFLSI